MDNITIERINNLHPNIRKTVLNAYTHINNKLLGKGIRLRFAYTTRTPEEQAELYAQGRTKLFDKNGKRLGKVTNAKPFQSMHNYSLAWDVVLLYDKNNDGVFETASWDQIIDFDKDGESDWKEVIEYFKSIKGVTWGGDFKSISDAPHFEINFGFDWQTLKARWDKGITIVDNGITYVKI